MLLDELDHFRFSFVQFQGDAPGGRGILAAKPRQHIAAGISPQTTSTPCSKAAKPRQQFVQPCISCCRRFATVTPPHKIPLPPFLCQSKNESLRSKRTALNKGLNELADSELLALREADNFVCMVFVGKPERAA